MARKLLVLLCLAGAVALSEAQNTQCAPRIIFFPRGGEDRNIPHAWGKTAQMAAGNTRDDQVFTVALTSTNNLPGIIPGAVPVLHVQPVHPLLVAGSSGLPPACTGFVPKPTATKVFTTPATKPSAAAELSASQDTASSAAAEQPALQDTAAADQPASQDALAAHEPASQGTAAAAASAGPTLRAKTNPTAAGGTTAAAHPWPATGDLSPTTRHLLHFNSSSSSSTSSSSGGSTWVPDMLESQSPGRHLLGNEAVTLPAKYKLQYWLNSSNPMDLGEFDMMTPVQRIVLNGLNNYEDGYYCLNIRLTIVQGSGRVAGWISVPPFDLTATSQVCFYKMDGRPSAKVDFSTCRETLTIRLRDMKPQPVPLYPGSQRSLFSSVFHFYSSLNKTKDWSWPPDSTPKSLDQWVVLDSGASHLASQPHVWVPDDKVAEGWYNIRLDASITSDFPALMALGAAVPGSYDEATAPPEIKEKKKMLSTPQYRNGTLQGIQYVQTEFKSLTGPEEANDGVRYAVNDEMQLNWEFEGLGDTFCFMDGVNFHNYGDFTCRPPVNVRIPDRRNHTLRVAMQDVCNETFVVDAVYGVWGYKVIKAPLPRVKPTDDAQYISTGEKYEVGSSAAATLRAPKGGGKAVENSAGVSRGTEACRLLVTAWWAAACAVLLKWL